MGWLKGAYLRVERVLYDGLRARADARLAARARKHGQRPQPTHLITGERGEALIRRISVAGWTERKDLPDALPGLLQKVGEGVRLGAKFANAVRSRQRCRVQQDTAGS